MEIWEIILIGVALAMDAVAVGMTNGMTMRGRFWGKALVIAATFGLFQFLMPVVGYYAGYAFSAAIARVAPWVSFALLFFVGGKTVIDFFRKKEERAPKQLTAGRLLWQGVATSLDALAIGVTLLAEETADGLPMHAVLCALLIGVITFALVLPAVWIGKKVGDRFSEKAELLGGIVLIAIGIKILAESFF